ncbi:MAG TPA: phosphoribosylaminoimidazolesuccinocarboxamide synthase [Candidatus Polarisedimenticolaceae bacterium]
MSAIPSTVYRTELPGIPLVGRGKVRDIFDLGDRLLFVASDRLSAFDVVFPTPIPDKGKVLNQLSAFWFERFASWMPNHVVETDVSRFPEALLPFAGLLAGRSMVVRKLRMLPVECVARGYLAGSGWKEYREHGTVCGIPLPPGLREADRLPEPIFTPATKAETGHDVNIPYADVVALLGEALASRIRDATLRVYGEAAAHARERGVIIADTKFEFGLDGDRLVLADEVLTPDSSRYWPVAGYAPGGSPPSLDKQFIRDWLESIGWAKTPPAPPLPLEIVEGATRRYREIFRILAAKELDES